ncbi:hypothetical protein ABQE69_16390 [Mycolicibacillus trivialis]|uniref:ATP/GTP-binding protein n=1 Tax=Mycolicibacillus trivialis TaxID=1798 RepID=A0A1X2EEF8_9MYCO|nr:hypothetical protein [Mycolicibacillus trivialis]ORW99302.1 hypothetical protein AWC30_16720 [Mycolicibacillus trivialis]
MPRRRPRRPPPPPPLPTPQETGPDGRPYRVRPVPAARAVKNYRCPGCDHEIRTGTAHVVAWPSEAGDGGLEDRRHWHTPCWANRANRGPTRRWS